MEQSYLVECDDILKTQVSFLVRVYQIFVHEERGNAGRQTQNESFGASWAEFANIVP